MATNASTKNMVGAAVLSSLLALSFNAYAQQPAHPILDTSTGATAYSGDLANQIAATGVDLGQLLARGAVTTLEAALKQPSVKPRVVYFPADAGVDNPRVVMGISPDIAAPVYVCLEGAGHFNKWEIANSGSVTENKDTMPTVQGRTPCQSWLLSALKGTGQPMAKETPNK